MIFYSANAIKVGSTNVDSIYYGSNLAYATDQTSKLVYELNDTSDGYIVKDVLIPIVGDLSIPSTYNSLPVVEIGDECFSGNDLLTSATIGGNVVTIGQKAFEDCVGLTSISIPDSVTQIKTRAYDGCHNATSLSIGNNVTTIFGYAFAACFKIASINIPDSVTSIGTRAFENCQVANPITIGSGLTNIVSNLFSTCKGITEITIPSGITSISYQVFNFCTSLTTINCLATTAPSIEVSSFFGNPATTINVPVGASGYGTTYGGLTVNYSL